MKQRNLFFLMGLSIIIGVWVFIAADSVPVLGGTNTYDELSLYQEMLGSSNWHVRLYAIIRIAESKKDQGVKEFEYMLFSNEYKHVVEKICESNKVVIPGNYYDIQRAAVVNSLIDKIDSKGVLDLLVRYYYSASPDLQKMDRSGQIRKVLSQEHGFTLSSSTSSNGLPKSVTIINTIGDLDSGPLEIIVGIEGEGRFLYTFVRKQYKDGYVWIPVRRRVDCIY